MPEAFQVFDPSGSGHVDMKELRHIVSHLVSFKLCLYWKHLEASEDARGNCPCEEVQTKKWRLDYAWLTWSDYRWLQDLLTFLGQPQVTSLGEKLTPQEFEAGTWENPAVQSTAVSRYEACRTFAKLLACQHLAAWHTSRRRRACVNSWRSRMNCWFRFMLIQDIQCLF